MLESLTDPQKWIDDTLADITEAAEKPIEESRLGKELLKQLNDALQALIGRGQEARRAIAEMPRVFARYVTQLDELHQVFQHWQSVLKTEGLDMLISEVRDFKNPTAPSIPTGTDGKELAQYLLKSVKEATTAAPLEDFLAFNSAEWRDGMAHPPPRRRLPRPCRRFRTTLCRSQGRRARS